MTELLPHQQRVVQEHQELTEKTTKLFAFLQTETFKQLPLIDRNLLLDQYAAMLDYNTCLRQRIARFT